MNCKAVGSTMVWVTFIIFLVLVFFAFGIGFAFLTGEKVLGEGPVIDVAVSDRVIVEKLVNVLDEKIIVDSEEMSVGEAIVDLESYYEVESEYPGKGSLMDWYYDKNSYHRIGLDRISHSDARGEGFDEDEVTRLLLKNKEVGFKVADGFKKVCDEFMLFTPLGPITEKGLMAWSVNEIERNFAEGFGVAKWGKTVEIKLYSKGREFKIKYRQLKEC